MDVGNPSNLERLQSVFHLDWRLMSDTIHGEVVSDTDTLEGISYAYDVHQLFIDPHTSVGFTAARRFLSKTNERDTHIVVLSTAHPAKFRETVEKATGRQPELPSALKRVLALPEQSVRIGNTLEDVVEFMKNRF